MKSNVKWAAVAALALVGWASQVQAGNTVGYVCSVSNRPPLDSNDGPSGTIVFSLYSAPDCAGSFLRTVTICSASTVGGTCHTPTPFSNHFLGLLKAASENIKVNTSTYSIFGSDTSIVYYVEFLAN